MSGIARWIAIAAGYCAICLVVYAPALQGEFIWDDRDIYIVNNSTLAKPDGLYRFWFTTEPIDYYPLAYTGFWFEVRLWGLNPTGYHVTNVIIHCLAAAALATALELLGVRWAWLAGLIFAVHPVNVESVAWICQRKTILGGAFAFATVALWLRGWRWAALFAFVLSLAGKPIAITLPVWLLVLAWWKREPLKQTALRTAPFFLVSLVFGVVGIWFQQINVIGEGTVRSESLLERCIIASWTLWFYFWKGLFPTNLMFVYPRWSADSANPISYLPAIVLLLIAAAMWRHRESWGRHGLLALAWIVLMVLPASGFVDVYYWRYSFVGDHYQYAALAATVGVFVILFDRMFQRLRAPLAVQHLAGTIIVLTLAAYSLILARDYESEERLWSATIAKNPSAWLAHTNLGIIRHAQGRIHDAAKLYDTALKLRPDLAESHVNCGFMYSLEGNPKAAVESYEKALAINPLDSRTLVNLALAHVSLGNDRDALARFQQAVEVAKKQRWHGSPNTRPLNELGDHLTRVEQFDEALAAFAKSKEMNPLDPMPWIGEGRAYLAKNDSSRAIECFNEALRLNPQFGETLFHLALANDSIGKPQVALEYLNQAAASHFEARVSLAFLLAGSKDESVRNPAAALAIAEGYQPAVNSVAAKWDTYAIALAANGRFPEAIEATMKAIAACKANPRRELKPVKQSLARLNDRLAGYRDNKPFRGGLVERVPFFP